MDTTGDSRLDAELSSLIGRLTERFGQQVDRTVIEDTVRRHCSSFAQARIRDFVPLLVERLAVAELTIKASKND